MLWSVDKAWLKNIFFSVCLARVIGKLRSPTEKTECRRLQAFRVLHINKNLTLESTKWQWWKILMCFLMAKVLVCTHSACSTSHALAFFIFKEECRCVTFLEVCPCICIWWKAWFHLSHLLLTSISSPCRNIKSRFKHLHAVLMVLCWTACPELLTHWIQMPHACRTPDPLAPGQVGCDAAHNTPAGPVPNLRCLSLQLNCRRGRSFSRASSKKHCST